MLIHMFNSTKISAAFLAIVLVTGTITLIAPSFMVGAAAQAQQDYSGMDSRYNSYEPEPGYPPQYAEKEYNNYPREYEMDSYKQSYRNYYYEQPEYPSYKPDSYKPKYPSYGKDKSKDSSSVSINKLNCINTNFINIGNINGSINTFAPGRTADSEGDTDAGSLGWNGEGYDNGYNKQKDKGFSCIINNTINNTIVGGNATDGNGNVPEPRTCEECFTEILTPEQISDIEVAFGSGEPGEGIVVDFDGFQVTITSFEQFCELLLMLTTTTVQLDSVVNQLILPVEPDPSPETIADIVDCIAAALDINTDTSASNINTAGSLVASSFSSPPTIAQGTEEDLSALEKIEKLKKQWLDLLP